LSFIDDQNVLSARFPAVGLELLVVILKGPLFDLPLWNEDNVNVGVTLQDILVKQVGESGLPTAWRTPNLCQTSEFTALGRCNGTYLKECNLIESLI